MTEAAVHSTVFEVEETDPAWKSVPYGVPLRNMRARVVDGRGRDCPDLVPGELWIGGPGVANGYRGDPGRTAERFVDHDGERWYRSGDLARYRPDGVLEFLGRADHQVKIGGHRIELGRSNPRWRTTPPSCTRSRPSSTPPYATSPRPCPPPPGHRPRTRSACGRRNAFPPTWSPSASSSCATCR